MELRQACRPGWPALALFQSAGQAETYGPATRENRLPPHAQAAVGAVLAGHDTRGRFGALCVVGVEGESGKCTARRSTANHRDGWDGPLRLRVGRCRRNDLGEIKVPPKALEKKK